MPEPNVVDLIFGRIDRNTDTSYRDRALIQNQNQFTSQLDQDKLKMLEAQRQFNKSIGLDESKFEQTKGQQKFANDLTIGESVAKNLFKVGQPVDPTSTTGMSGMLNQSPLAPGSFNVNGQTLIPVDQVELQRTTALRQAKDQAEFKKQQEQSEVDYLTKQGMSPLMAAMSVHNPQIASHIYSNPKSMMNALLDAKTPKSVMDKFINTFGQLAAAEETPSQRAQNQASAANAYASAGLHNEQTKALQAQPKGELLYNQAAAAAAAKGINSSDPRYIGAIHSFINDAVVDPAAKAAAGQIAVRDLQHRTIGQSGGILQQLLQQNQTPTTQPNVVNPPPASGRESGSPSPVVNTKPAQVTGPVGQTRNDPLRFTQPAQPVIPGPMQELLDRYKQQQIERRFNQPNR